MSHHDSAASSVPAAVASDVERSTTGTADDLADSLTCPGCDAALATDAIFARFRVCSACERHFPLPARERLALLADAGSFVETNGVLVALSPLIFRDHLPLPGPGGVAASPVGPAAALGEAVISGTATIGGLPVALLVLDHTYLGGNLGPVAAEKVTLALEQAASRRHPLIALCAASYPGMAHADEARAPGGLLSLAQWPKIAAAASRMHDAGVLFVTVLAHPTLGGVFAGLGQQADIVLAEPGARVGLTAGVGPDAAATLTTEALLAAGQLDAVVDRRRQASMIAHLLALLGGVSIAAPPPAEAPPSGTAESLPTPPWPTLSLARHADRPLARELLPLVVNDLVTLHGDRISGDDPTVTGGVGRIGGRPVLAVACAPEAAMTGLTAAGCRKAARLVRLAVRFELPVVTLIDASPSEMAPDAGVALADLLALTSRAPVPLVSAVVGVGTGLALMALGNADRRLMLQHAVLGVDPIAAGEEPVTLIAPTGVGWRARTPVAASEALRLGLIDQIVPEPVPGAHADAAGAAALLAAALRRTLDDVHGLSRRRLLAARADRLRAIGPASPAGHEAARREIRELQERQRRLAKSLADLRERVSDRTRHLPRLPRPALPGVPNLARPAARDSAKLSSRVPPELVDLAERIADGVRHRSAAGRESSGGEVPASPESSG